MRERQRVRDSRTIAIPTIEVPGRNGVPAIKVEQLTKTYPGGVEAVKAIDFEVAPGEVFGLLGPNGAGKSTTVGMLLTTVKPTSRRAQRTISTSASQPRGGASAVVFQESVIDQRPLTGRRNLAVPRLWDVEVASSASTMSSRPSDSASSSTVR